MRLAAARSCGQEQSGGVNPAASGVAAGVANRGTNRDFGKQGGTLGLNNFAYFPIISTRPLTLPRLKSRVQVSSPALKNRSDHQGFEIIVSSPFLFSPLGPRFGPRLVRGFA